MRQVSVLDIGRRSYALLSNQCDSSAVGQANNENITKTLQFLDYTASHEEVVLTYNASDMVHVDHSNISYHLSGLRSESRAGEHFFLSSNTDIPANNGVILNIAHIIKHIVAFATEAELAAL
ncbi:hypothetical protein ACHAWF_001275 [Thalassiosira exigua]